MARRDIPCSWTGRFNIVKISSVLPVVYRFNAVPSKIPARFYVDIDKIILKIL